MIKNEGFVVLNRKIINWEWYRYPKTSHFFIYCICRANWKNDEWHGISIPRGAFISSLSNMSKETGLSIDEIRTAIKHLIITKEITKVKNSKFTMIYVNNYDKYQDFSHDISQENPNDIPTDFPIDNQINNINNKTRNKREPFRPPTIEEVAAYCSEMHYTINPETFVSYYESNGWKVGKNPMKDWKSAVRGWQARDKDHKAESKPVEISHREYDYEDLERRLLGE